MAWNSTRLVCVIGLMCGVASAVKNGSCKEVRQVFVMKRIGASHLVLDSWTEGNHLEFCPSQETCCSKLMEDKYISAVKKDFQFLLQWAGSHWKKIITTSAVKFKDAFLDMVQVAENSTNELLWDVYRSLDEETHSILGQLFADLLAYISGQDVDLEDRISSFFESLFPLAYKHSVNHKQELTDSYKACLLEVRPEVRPFGDFPQRISSPIVRSFGAARTLLEALHLGVEVINTTEHLDFGPECRGALVRLSYCPHCHGFLHSKPCLGMCLNVLRGCLSSVAELDDAWSEYVGALERLTSSMVGDYNIELVLSTLDIQISDTFVYIFDNIQDISKTVKQKCGPLRRVNRDTLPAPPRRPHPQPLPDRPSLDISLSRMLKSFILKIVESKDFFSNLADHLCNNGNVIVKGDLSCWNGSELGGYTKTIAGIGVSAQKYNPEMTPSSIRDVSINLLADKLHHVKQMLVNSLTSIPLSDSSVMSEGSGSGAWWGSRTDDEDYTQSSGSGDSAKGDRTDLHFVRSDEKLSVKTGNANWSCSFCSFEWLLLFSLSWISTGIIGRFQLPKD